MLKILRNKFKILGQKALENTLPIIAREAELDVVFYRSYYPDLHLLKNDEVLVDHFVEHGSLEGRFPNAVALIQSLEAQFGRLPLDFIPDHYRRHHQDLDLMIDPWALKEHYLRYGRDEGRKYCFDLSNYEHDFSKLIASGEGLFHRIKTKGQQNSFAQTLFDAGVLPGPWLDRFMFFEFSILNAEWLPRKPLSQMDGICLFLQHGISRLAPIAMHETFDPGFYRLHDINLLSDLSDSDLYRDWLNRGLERGLPSNEKRALIDLIGDERFPDCFDEKKYRRNLKKFMPSPATGRFNALKHYMIHGFKILDISVLNKHNISQLLEQIGEYHLGCGNTEIALKAFSHALPINPRSAMLHHRRGDTLRALGRGQEAVADFIAAADLPGSTVWSHIHAADGLAAQPEGIEAALDRIQRSASTWRSSAAWRAAGHRVIGEFFNAVSTQAFVLYAEDRREEADVELTDCLDRIVILIRQIDPLPARLDPPGNGHIVIIANRDLPQCDHYRVVQRQRQLEQGGWTVEIFDQWKLEQCRPAINRADAVIFYRVAAFPRAVHAMLYARALGIQTIYDIDDLIFDAKCYPDPLHSFEGQITRRDYASLQYGVPLFHYAMRLCDIGLASTPALAEAVRPLMRSRTCHILRNGLDQRNLPFLKRSTTPFSSSMLTVFYGSGTKAHNRDFTDLLAPALLAILQQHTDVRIVIAGYLSLDERFGPFAHRVKQLGFNADVSAYWEVLSGADINLAVLAQNTTTDAKSEIKWLEAAMCGIPSIVSPTRTYREVIVDGEDGILAQNPADWLRALDTLICDPNLRRHIGARARVKALANYGLDNAIATLASFLPSPSSAIISGILTTDWMTDPASHSPSQSRQAQSPTNSNRKSRLLIVNVYFPPQTIGGATRVVRDNVDYFLDHATEHFDIAVVAADNEAEPAYQTRIDAYRGVPVYRISSPREMQMDWRPFNPEMGKSFENFLNHFQPDLIHFHCLQRLTGTVVEVAQVRNIPYIITLHDAWWISDFQFLIDKNGQVQAPSPDYLADATDPALSPTASIARRRGLGRLLEGAHMLLAVSHTFADVYRAAGARSTRALPNGVSAIVPAIRQPSRTGRVRLGQIGGRTTHKGATLIEAVLRSNTFANLELTMINHGRASGNVRDETWGATYVHLIGFVPQEQIANLYANLDVLLAPSLWPESFGLVTREARASGLWVVASDRGAIGEDILENIDGFKVDVGSLEGLTEVLARIDADPDRFLQSPPKILSSHRTIADQSLELLDLYQSIIDN